MKFKKLLLACSLSATMLAAVTACDTEQSCNKKITQLENLIKTAQQKNLDTNREECAVFMAKLFLKFAAWDADNIKLNTYQYSMWESFKADAERYANELPEFERSEVEKMLDSAISEITAVISGDVVRRDVPEIDWTSIKLDTNGQFISNGRPVYFNHFNRVPEGTSNEYTGLMDRIPLGIDLVANKDGDLTQETINSIVNKQEGNSGFVFVNHTPPKWVKDIDPEVTTGSRRFVPYDIDNPLIREMWVKTAEKVIPYIKDRRSADQGYMLSNEPHWFTEKDVWATGVFSKHTMAKFRVWLENKHKNISRLNKLWNTNFKSFADVDVEIPFDKDYVGQPIGYDIMRFNQERVIEWFTFLNKIIKEHDPEAKTHIKVMPHLFEGNTRDHGLDFEQLTLMSDIIGNDAKATGRLIRNKYAEPWEAHFNFNWGDIGMGYDFMESVKPNMANINTESHYLSTSLYRDIYMTKEYTRAAYWLATLQGMTISYTWFWPREDSGAIPKALQAGSTEYTDNSMPKSYVASVIQQPRVTNEVAKTYMDINSFGFEMAELQSLSRPMRIFYSETTSINDVNYMHALSELYEPLFFEGNAMGFATENIINSQDNKSWDVILVRKSTFVKDSEFKALQKYLDNGGTVVIDNLSLKLNEYGESRTQQLKESNGKIYRVASAAQYISKGLEVLSQKGSSPELSFTEVNANGHKGCVWRMIPSLDGDGGYVVNIINVGKDTATLTVKNSSGEKVKSVTDMFTMKPLSSTLSVKPNDVLMIKVMK
ncbi:MAG: beta-galactosidase [Rikenellaceae bacterium]